MSLLLGVLIVWANSAVASIICWSLYMFVWTFLHMGKYPTIAACKADFDRNRLNRVLSRWMWLEVLPVRWLLAQYRRYHAFLVHQQTLAQLRRLGWQVESQEQVDGSLEVHCTARGQVSMEMVERAQAIVEKGLRQL